MKNIYFLSDARSVTASHLLDNKFSTFFLIYQYQSYDCKIKKLGKGGFVYGKG